MDSKGTKATIVAVVIVVIIAALGANYALDHGSDEGDLTGEVYVIHTNDTHGYYDDNLGFTKVVALRDDLESRGATVFLLDAGDAFQGTQYTCSRTEAPRSTS